MVSLPDWLRPRPERALYAAEFAAVLDRQAKALQRPFGAVCALVWVSYAVAIDPRLHPEFPELLFFRAALTLAGTAVFVLSFFERLRGRGRGLLYLLVTFCLLNCSFWTGRIADDPNYVSGLQIIIVVIVVGPFLLRTILAFYGLSVALFLAGVLIWEPELSTDAARYSMNNLAVAYVVGAVLAWVLDRFRFASFLQQRQLTEAKETAERAARAKSEFLASMSREIGAPMGMILDLAGGAAGQEEAMARQVGSTAAALEAVDGTARAAGTLVDRVQQAATSSTETAELAASCRTDLERMRGAMESMAAASRSLAGRLSAVDERARSITDIVTTIARVADQTNLLSLNAAIEAEKAGEHGRGFGVVASEVRRLADQTAVATLDIDETVREMQAAVATGVREVDRFIAEVQRSSGDVSALAQRLGEVITQVQAIAPGLEGVSEAMAAQADASREVSGAVAAVGGELQRTMSTLRETYASVEQLAWAARALQEEVARFGRE